MTIRTSLVTFALLAVALTVAACGGDSDPYDGEDPTPTRASGDLLPGFTFTDDLTACDILTGRLVASAVDNETADPVPSDDGYACTWAGDGGELTLAVRDAGSAEAATDALNEIDKVGDSIDSPGEAYFTSESSTAAAVESYVFEVSADTEKNNLDIILDNITLNVAVALTSE